MKTIVLGYRYTSGNAAALTEANDTDRYGTRSCVRSAAGRDLPRDNRKSDRLHRIVRRIRTSLRMTPSNCGRTIGHGAIRARESFHERIGFEALRAERTRPFVRVPCKSYSAVGNRRRERFPREPGNLFTPAVQSMKRKRMSHGRNL